VTEGDVWRVCPTMRRRVESQTVAIAMRLRGLVGVILLCVLAPSIQVKVNRLWGDVTERDVRGVCPTMRRMVETQTVAIARRLRGLVGVCWRRGIQVIRGWAG